MVKIFEKAKTTCEVCGKTREDISGYLNVCKDCIKDYYPPSSLPPEGRAPGSEKAKKLVFEAHQKAREKIGLPAFPPKNPRGIKCNICGNECQIPEGKVGYCGLSRNVKGKLVRDLGTKEIGLIYCYRDSHPTNCVAAPFCAGGTGAGYPKYSKSKAGPEYGYLNASLFCGTCCFHCLYCQNTDWHRMIKMKTETMETEELVNWMLSEERFTEAHNDLCARFTCMCWFGGTPEPQMPFVCEVSKKVREKAKKQNRIFRVCLESNGNFAWPWLEKIAKISLESGGGIKFDLKAWNENLNLALSGISNKKTYQNFEKLGKFHKKRPNPPFLRASTLLVPHYITEDEIRSISEFIASVDKTIPYSLLAFYPHYLMSDIGFTSGRFAKKCYRIAKKAGLKKVRIGNVHLLK